MDYWSSHPIESELPKILIFHALTGNKNANLWWKLDSLYSKYCCICFTIPSSAYHDSKYGFNIEEECEIIYMALCQLKVYHLKAVIGGSLGGFFSLCFAQKYPTIVDYCVCLAASAKCSDWLLCWNEVQRQALYMPNGLPLARMIAMLSYRSPKAFDAFGTSTCKNKLYHLNGDIDKSCTEEIDTSYIPVDAQQVPTPTTEYLDSPHSHAFASWSYLHYQAYKFNSRFTKEDYLVLLDNMDRFTLKHKIQIPVLSIGFNSDILFPSYQVKEIQSYCTHPSSHHITIDSDLGHDAFLVETNTFLPTILTFIK